MHVLKLIILLLGYTAFGCKQDLKSNNALITTLPPPQRKVAVTPAPLLKDTIYIQNGSLLIRNEGREFEYKDLIVNGMSLTTDLTVVEDKSFILSYDFTASAVKRLEIMHFSSTPKGIRLHKIFNIHYDPRLEYGFGWAFFWKSEPYVDVDLDMIWDEYPIFDYNQERNVNCGAKVEIIYDEQIYNFSKCDKRIKLPLFDIDNKKMVGHYLMPKKLKNPFFFGEPTKLDFVFNQNEAVESLNNNAYFLEQAGLFSESASILEFVTKKYPDRVVAYINLGDAYWGLQQTEKAKTAYQTYLKLMKEQGKTTKIPQRVIDRS